GERLLLEGLAEATAVEDHLSALRAINNLAHPAFPVWEPERSAALLDEMAGLIARSGRQDWTGSHALLETAFLAFVRGDLVAARDALETSPPPASKWAWRTLMR